MKIFIAGIVTCIVIGIVTYMRAAKSVVEPTLKQIADIIDNFLNGTSGPYEWQDFVTYPFKTPELERIRKECSDIKAKYPPDNTKDWCNELGKNALCMISERIKDEIKSKRKPTAKRPAPSV